MVKTYIYGVPHGFDFYEKDAELNAYFKGFYISSRRGRRLLINRRDNGETVYSYLRYGLKEIERQPLHSFFGMSLVVDNYQFCPNFKVLLEWFDFLFEKMVKERNVIKNEDGVYHYVIHRFEESAPDIEWLKSNLPNILTHAGQTEILNYDASFVCGKSGQVVSFNNPVSEKYLLETFKKYSSISISAEITEYDIDTSHLAVQGTVELNYEELNGKLNALSHQLLPIAVDISKSSYQDLKRMSDEVQDISKSLSNFIPSIEDYEEKDKFKILEDKYASLKDSIVSILSKIDSPYIQQETQFCFTCKQTKPLHHFESPNSTKCLECQKREGIASGVIKAHKTCVICGEKKATIYFNQNDRNICDDCVGTQGLGAISSQGPTVGKTVSLSKYKGILAVLISIGLIVAVTFVVKNLIGTDFPYETTYQGERQNVTVTQKIDTKVKRVDKEKLDSLFESSKLSGLNQVYEYLKDKADTANYIGLVRDKVNAKIITTIVSLQSKEKALKEIVNFRMTGHELLEFIGLTNDELGDYQKFIEEFFLLRALIQKNKITQTEKEKGDSVIHRYGNQITQDVKHSWSNVTVEFSTYNLSANDSINVKFTNPAGSVVEKAYSSNDNCHHGIEIKQGTYVTIEFIGGYIRTKNEVYKKKKGLKDKRKFAPNVVTEVFFGDSISLTISPITPKTRTFSE